MTPEQRRDIERLLRCRTSGRPHILDASLAAVVPHLARDPGHCDRANLVGRELAGYRLLGLLGSGGTACVFRATRLAAPFGPGVALKILRRPLLLDVARMRFERECEVLASLSHDCFPRYLDAFVDADGIAGIAMELVPGHTLDEHAVRLGPGMTARIHLLAGVCRVVALLHEQGFVHLDLKPANIRVTSDGAIRILDFGNARRREPSCTLRGRDEPHDKLTPGYAAPEQFNGGMATAATDVHALGMVIREILLDRDGGIRSRSPLAPQLLEIVCACVARNPAKRCQSALEVALRLERCA